MAEERVKKEGVEHLVNFEVIDYRTFARRADNQGKFDRVISCEMIEAVGKQTSSQSSRNNVLATNSLSSPTRLRTRASWGIFLGCRAGIEV